jgi:hypothetical protein
VFSNGGPVKVRKGPRDNFQKQLLVGRTLKNQIDYQNLLSHIKLKLFNSFEKM